jgi:hypothetical protein
VPQKRTVGNIQEHYVRDTSIALSEVVMICTQIDGTAGLVTHTGTGDLTLEEMVAAFEERLHHPGFRPGMKILWDCREASFATLSNDQIQRLIEHNGRLQNARGGGMSAIVVSRDLDYGIGRVFQAYADGLPWDTMVFRDLESAMAWLGYID